jgi:hypothetical protein
MNLVLIQHLHERPIEVGYEIRSNIEVAKLEYNVCSTAWLLDGRRGRRGEDGHGEFGGDAVHLPRIVLIYHTIAADDDLDFLGSMGIQEIVN